jgi:hypothetical protein
MPWTLGDLIKFGKISDRCLHCHRKLQDRDCEVASRILETVQFQQIHDYRDYDCHVDLWTLARCRFCLACAKAFPQRFESYRQKLTKNLTDEVAGKAVPQQSENYHPLLVKYSSEQFVAGKTSLRQPEDPHQTSTECLTAKSKAGQDVPIAQKPSIWVSLGLGLLSLSVVFTLEHLFESATSRDKEKKKTSD